jgi:hypothetical protein
MSRNGVANSGRGTPPASIWNFQRTIGIILKKGEGNNFIGIYPYYQLVSIPNLQMIPGAFKFHAQLK